MKRKFYNSKLFVLYLTILILLNSGYALATVYSFNLIYFKILTVLLLLIPAINNIMKKKLNLNFVLVFLFIFGIILTMVASGFDNVNGYIGYIITLFLSIEIMLLYNFDSIKKYFIKLMVFISIISLIGYSAVNIFSISLPTITNINGTQYGNGLLYFSLKGNEIRNCGLFWEPGVFASFLTLAILFILLDEGNEYKKSSLYLFYITLLTVNSSAGLILMLLTLLILLLKNKINKNKVTMRDAIKFIIFCCAILLILNLDKIIINYFYDNKFIMKLLSNNILNSSRYTALQINWQLFLDSPIWGVGISQYGILTSNYISTDMSTSVSLLSIFGITGIIYTLMIIRGAFRIKNVNYYIKVIVSLILLIIVNKEPHHNILFTWIVILCFNSNNLIFRTKPIKDREEFNIEKYKSIN